MRSERYNKLRIMSDQQQQKPQDEEEEFIVKKVGKKPTQAP
jgi:hypothetical protein